MKRVLCSVVLLLAASVSFAQVSKVKEAKSLAEESKPDFAKAQSLINDALQNPETANDPNTWNIAGLIQKKINEKENEKLYLRQPFDTATYYNSIYRMFEYYLKCDELAQMPNEKGKIKNKFRKANTATMLAERINLAAGGGDFFNKGNYEEAFKLLAMYADVTKAPMLESANLAATDTLLAMYSYYAALAAYQTKNYKAVPQYTAYADGNAEFGKDALQLCADAYKVAGDTDNWLATIKEGVQKYPEHIYFIVSMVDHFTGQNKLSEAEKVAEEFVAQKPNDPQALYIQGYIYTLTKNYAGAQKSLEKAIALDGQNANYYCWLGHSYFYKAQDIIKSCESLDINSPEYQGKQNEIKDLYKKAMPYYEKAKDLSPEDKNLWQNLYTIYYALNMGDEFERIGRELGL